jgi:ATP-dependent Lon protease
VYAVNAAAALSIIFSREGQETHVATQKKSGPGATTSKQKAVDSGQNSEGSPEPKLTGSTTRLLILPIRGAVLFPHNILPLTAGKEWSSRAIETAIKAGDHMGIVTQRDPNKAEVGISDLYTVGTEARVLKVIRFPDGTQGAVVQGARRFRIQQASPASSKQNGAKAGDEIHADVTFFDETPPQPSLRISALGRGLRQLVQKAVTLSPNVPNEANLFVENVTDPAYLADLVIPYLGLEYEQKQELLETEDLEKRLKKVHYHLTREIEVLEVSQKIHTEVRTEVGKQQRKYYLREQLKLLQKELGDIDGRESSTLDESTDLTRRIENSAMPTEAKQSAQREVDRMNIMQPGSPEYLVSHSYVTWLLDVPWEIQTQTSVDLKKALAILDEDHFGLEKIKKRILEYLAVYALKSDLKGPILLLSGPPGVGKTSLGRSVARALGRKFVRISLGGLRDEAEIRGHRRTYIGSLPGKIIDALKKAGSMDPVILLDEIDKLGNDFRGDPASALLEVLDPEQNHNFIDHYLNTPVDLSKVMFIATANNVGSIPAPLLDRMEPIPLAGYTLQEKLRIAERFLIPQVTKEHGLDSRIKLKLTDAAIKDMIESYTREAGVRQLKRELSGIARGLARNLVESGNSATKRIKAQTLTTPEVENILGTPKFLPSRKADLLPPGVALGLAYTSVGGDMLYVEAAANEGDGSGKLLLTGQLGDVMKESVQTALTFLRANASKLATELSVSHATLPALVLKKDIHVHFPDGATPKDGPSAGVAVLCALASLVLNKRLSNKLAMTGEISLRGSVLPVGGIKEKLLAAHRHGIQEVILPRDNAKDLDDLPKDARAALRIHFVETMTEALLFALHGPNKGNAKSHSKAKATKAGAGKKKLSH